MIFAVAAIVFAGTAAPTPRPTSTPVPAPPVEMTVVRSRPDIDGCFLPMGEAFEPGVACMARIVADETAANAPASVLCVQGAELRARQGATAFEILARYFPGTRVARPESE